MGDYRAASLRTAGTTGMRAFAIASSRSCLRSCLLSCSPSACSPQGRRARARVRTRTRFSASPPTVSTTRSKASTAWSPAATRWPPPSSARCRTGGCCSAPRASAFSSRTGSDRLLDAATGQPVAGAPPADLAPVRLNNRLRGIVAGRARQPDADGARSRQAPGGGAGGVQVQGCERAAGARPGDRQGNRCAGEARR